MVPGVNMCVYHWVVQPSAGKFSNNQYKVCRRWPFGLCICEYTLPLHLSFLMREPLDRICFRFFFSLFFFLEFLYGL